MADLAEKLKECNLADASVKFTRETVCPIKADAVEENMTLSVAKSYPPDRQDDIDKFKESAKELIENFGVEVGLKCEVGEGCQYQTITDITSIHDPETKKTLEHDGQVWLLDFWATWCPPCRAEMPAIDRLAAAMADRDVAVIAISTDRRSTDRVAAFFEEIEVKTLPVLHDKGGKLAREAAVLGLPVTLILDRQGREIARLQGEAHWDSDEVKALLVKLVELTAPDT